MQDLKKHIASFFPFAQKQLGFKRPPKLFFVNDKQNAGETLGKTAHYEPETETIKVYVTNRHPKDVLRSFSHELVHHAQNCRGNFDNDTVTEEGYTQSDPHLREMEREAYEKGNMIFRDYCDGLTNNGGLEQMSMTEEKLREAVRAAIQRLAEKNGGMPMKDEPEGKDLNGDGEEGHGKVPVFLKEKETEQVDEASMIDNPADAEKAEAAEEAAEGGESETKVNEEEEVAESVDELKEWYLGTLSESLVKRFTQK